MRFILFLLFPVLLSGQSNYLPKWFTQIPESKKNVVYAMGISDPKLDEKVAYEQAIFRAKIILSILNNSQSQQSKDFFTIKKETFWAQQLERLSVLKSSIELDTINVEVVKKFYNDYKEAIVLVKRTIPKDREDTCSYKETYTIENKTYIKETGNEAGGFDYVKNFEIKANGKTPDNKVFNKFIYAATDDNRNFKITHSWNDSTYRMPGTFHEYYGNVKINELDKNSYSGICRLDKGLWNAYYDAITQSIFNISDLKASKSKKSSDFYEQEKQNTSGKDEGLTRMVSNNTLSFIISQIDISDNRLWIKVHEDTKGIQNYGSRNRGFFGRLFN